MKHRIVVRNDADSWVYFIVGYCLEVSTAEVLCSLFKDKFPDRSFAVVSS